MSHKIRFDVINPATGKQEMFSGLFDTHKEANKWYKLHVEFWRERGKELIKTTIKKRNNF